MAQVLVIDDDEDVRHLIRRLLEARGHQVLEAIHGVDGLAKLEASEPQMIIADIFMPQMEGIEVVKRIRASDVKAPIMVVSGGGRDYDLGVLSWAKQVGADAVLAKPFTPEEFYDAMDHLALPRAIH